MIVEFIKYFVHRWLKTDIYILLLCPPILSLFHKERSSQLFARSQNQKTSLGHPKKILENDERLGCIK